MARSGLGSGWSCLWAKDIDVKKCASYTRNWRAGDLLQADVAELTSSDLPGPADLAWASLPWPRSVAGRIRKWKRAYPLRRARRFWRIWLRRTYRSSLAYAGGDPKIAGYDEPPAPVKGGGRATIRTMQNW